MTTEPDMPEMPPPSNETVLQQMYIVVGRLDNISIQLLDLARGQARLEAKLDDHLRNDHGQG